MKNINKTLLVLAICQLSVIICIGQTADEIIQKHIEAHGGKDNWEAIESIKISGKFTSFSERKDFTEIKARPEKYFADFFWGKHAIQEGRTGDFYWTINPWFDIPFARKTNAVESNIIDQKSEFCTPFLNFKDRGFKVEYLGKEEVDGVSTYKLELTRPGQQAETWYLNSNTYLEYMYTSMWGDFGSPYAQDTYFDDFRKVGEIVIPFYQEKSFSIRHRVIEIEKVELNVETHDSMFEIPLSDAMEKLKVFEGEWNVIVEVLNRRGTWTKADSTISSIKFLKNKNLLQEKISYVNYFPVEKIIRWTYNANSGNYMMSVFNDFYSSTDIFQGNFSGDTLLVDNSEIFFSSNREKEKSFNKYIFSNISEEGFLLEIAQTNSKGKDPVVRQKFTYTKRKKSLPTP